MYLCAATAYPWLPHRARFFLSANNVKHQSAWMPVHTVYLVTSALCCLRFAVQSIYGAFDPDQSRTEDAMADEALTNKEESREALSFVARLVVIPLITGALISRAITDPVLSFSLQVSCLLGCMHL